MKLTRKQVETIFQDHKEKRFLGFGRAAKFEKDLLPGEIALEEGHKVYAVPEDYYCQDCDGCGCRSCKWTGKTIKSSRTS